MPQFVCHSASVRDIRFILGQTPSSRLSTLAFQGGIIQLRRQDAKISGKRRRSVQLVFENLTTDHTDFTDGNRRSRETGGNGGNGELSGSTGRNEFCEEPKSRCWSLFKIGCWVLGLGCPPPFPLSPFPLCPQPFAFSLQPSLRSPHCARSFFVCFVSFCGNLGLGRKRTQRTKGKFRSQPRMARMTRIDQGEIIREISVIRG